MNSSTNAIAPAGTEARAERKLTTPTNLRDTHKKASAIDAIKAKYSVRDILAMCGVEIPSRDGVKFRSPFRPDANPSCTIFENRVFDHSSGESYDCIDCYALLKNVSTKQVLLDLGGGETTTIVVKPKPKPAPRQADTSRWPEMDEGTPAEIEQLAKLRGFSEYSIRHAQEQGFLRFADSKFGRVWIVTDRTRQNAQARLLSGDPWPDIEAKAKTLPGSLASVPLGLATTVAAEFIGIFEGGPDFLAGFDLLGHRNKGVPFACVGILGSSVKLEPFADRFTGKHVRIFAHADEAGVRAAERWSQAIVRQAEIVEIADLSGICKDANDLLRIGEADYYRHRDRIEEMLRVGGVSC